MCLCVIVCDRVCVCVCDGVSDVSLGLHIFACQDEDVPTLQMHLDLVTLSLPPFLPLSRFLATRAADKQHDRIV